MAKKEVQKEDSGKELLMALEILEKEKFYLNQVNLLINTRILNGKYII